MASEVYPRGWTVYDFEVIPTDDQNKNIVSWSSGTGEIAPTYFSVNENEYALEMDATMIKTEHKDSIIEDNEIIIWEKSDYLDKLNNQDN